jgi:hypothetical protein
MRIHKLKKKKKNNLIENSGNEAKHKRKADVKLPIIHSDRILASANASAL